MLALEEHIGCSYGLYKPCLVSRDLEIIVLNIIVNNGWRSNNINFEYD